jgi:hypothetical protein
MLTVDTSHFPSSDDITFDSLEYLFGTKPNTVPKPVPWVEIVNEKESAQYEREIQRLQEKLQTSNTQVQKLCAFAGYMQGLLHDKDVQLKLLPELRFRAGLAVARELETERQKEKIRELEEEIQRLYSQSNQKTEGKLKTLISSINTDEAAISLLMWLGLTGLTGVLYTLISG